MLLLMVLAVVDDWDAGGVGSGASAADHDSLWLLLLLSSNVEAGRSWAADLIWERRYATLCLVVVISRNLAR